MSFYFNIFNNPHLNKLKIKPETFIKNIVEFYQEKYKNGNSESLSKLAELIKCFPENKKILEIIIKNLLEKKEIFLLKVLLDLNLHYLLHIDRLNQNLIIELISLMKVFYNHLTNDQLKNIKKKIKQEEVYKNFYSYFQIANFSKKSNYFYHLKKIKNENLDLFSGIDKKKFII